jgi:hypothetical protein
VHVGRHAGGSVSLRIAGLRRARLARERGVVARHGQSGGEFAGGQLIEVVGELRGRESIPHAFSVHSPIRL